MEPSTVRDHFLTLLMQPLSEARVNLKPLLSRPIHGYSLAQSQWLWSSVIIFLDQAPDGVYQYARDYIRAVIHGEGEDQAAAAFLQSVNPLHG